MRSAAIAISLILIVSSASLVYLRVQQKPADFNPQSAVVPTLREWHGSHGHFAFHAGGRIVLESADAQVLNPTAEAIRDDLASLTGLRVGCTYYVGSFQRCDRVIAYDRGRSCSWLASTRVFASFSILS